MTQRIGIEKLAAYPGSLALAMPALCAARGHDLTDIRDTMMIDERSVNVPWEDPVTMAVNAAKPMLSERDRASIGLLVVASESGVDQEKPMSTWVQRYLGLSSRVRNIEVKHACYGATASLQLAASWIASGVAPGEKALVINTDQSRTHFGKPWEFVMGAAAVAVLVSDQPRILELELGRTGVHTNEVSDLTRPTSHVETGNSETSLLSYLDGLEGAFDDYVRRVPEAADFDSYFQRVIYHLPFGGMGLVAHRAMLRRAGIASKGAARDHFAAKTLPSLAYVRRMGGTYGSSTFLGLSAMLANDDTVKAGDRIGVFSYGSGSCAEWWSGRVCPEAREVVRAAGLPALLDARRQLTVAEYEAVETARTSMIDVGDHTTDRTLLGDWYERAYAGKGLLVFDGMREHYRQYGWS
ncbi:MAG TPA: hydroxymethylglutaryl-CoA synthase [Kofleriaceae bacterium]|jgi:hydroxymethylglutaryl-CoA synthase